MKAGRRDKRVRGSVQKIRPLPTVNVEIYESGSKIKLFSVHSLMPIGWVSLAESADHIILDEDPTSIQDLVRQD
jgi:hypothetical protein